MAELMSPYSVIKSPLITEKATQLGVLNKYAFVNHLVLKVDTDEL